jgi:FkbM family methyltransferase
MVANTAALGDRVQALHGAAWITDGHINLQTHNETGAPLGEWGVQVPARPGAWNRLTRCYRIGTLLDDAAFDTVDILKVDIEGAELELFAHGAHQWLPRVRRVVVETHDRFRPGSDDAVRAAMLPLFEELPRSGENLIFRRVGT